MDAKEKTVKILLLVALLMGMSAISITMAGEQRASVGSIFGPDNKNETVLKAQTKLKELGLYGGRASGLFGVRTRDAIQDFQKSNGLIQNGILDIPTQRALFAAISEPEYVSVGYTRAGNTFLAEWIRYILGIEGKRIELRGTLGLAVEDATYQNISTKLFLTSEDGGKYDIANISSKTLDGFLGQHVIVNGIMIPEENDAGRFTVLVNYIETDEENFPIAIGYTREGNVYVSKWVNKIYQENHRLSGLIGTLSVGPKVQYAPHGNSTQLVLATSDGTKYSVENIANSKLASFVGKDIMVRGIILGNTNALGFKTIVINYILNGEDNPNSTAATSVSN